MVNQPDLMMIDRAKLDELLSGIFPQSPGVRSDIIDELVKKSTPDYRGVTPNRPGRGVSIIQMAIGLAKKFDMDFDEMLEKLIRTTDVWEDRAKLQRELIGTYRQLFKHFREQHELTWGRKLTPDEQKNADDIQEALDKITWRLQDLESEESRENDITRQLRGA